MTRLSTCNSAPRAIGLRNAGRCLCDALVQHPHEMTRFLNLLEERSSLVRKCKSCKSAVLCVFSSAGGLSADVDFLARMTPVLFAGHTAQQVEIPRVGPCLPQILFFFRTACSFDSFAQHAETLTTPDTPNFAGPEKRSPEERGYGVRFPEA